jgi:hypothetical protein
MPNAREIPLTAAELQEPRSAADMLAWVDAAGVRFTSTKELRAEARRGKYFAKELMEEARPMAQFARRHYGAVADVLITHVLGNQHHDGTVDDRRAAPEDIRFIEVTGTRTYEDALRLELLSRNGQAPMLGPIERVKCGERRGQVEAQCEPQEHAHIVGNYLPLVLRAAEGKAANPHYGPGTALVIAVDDYMALREPEDVRTLDDFVRRAVIPLLIQQSPFVLVALEGGRELHLEYRLR